MSRTTSVWRYRWRADAGSCSPRYADFKRLKEAHDWRRRRVLLAVAVTIQARVEEAIKAQLDRYAEFISSTPSYVITEALKDLFRRDKEFKSWQNQNAGDTDEDAHAAAHHA
jgi:predicted transcriptional regulator